MREICQLLKMVHWIGVPEIIESANVVLQLLGQLPGSVLDRALVMPLCLTGCMVDSPVHREAIRNRLAGIGEENANVHQIMGTMVEVWRRRDTSRRAIDWREVMQERGLTLLLI